MFSQLARLDLPPNQQLDPACRLDSDGAGQRQAAISQLRQACRSELRVRTEPRYQRAVSVIDASAGQGGLPRGQIVEAVGKVGRLSLALGGLGSGDAATRADGSD
jgi:hypothetical protein